MENLDPAHAPTLGDPRSHVWLCSAVPLGPTRGVPRLMKPPQAAHDESFMRSIDDTEDNGADDNASEGPTR
jgi:hypothetical protein